MQLNIQIDDVTMQSVRNALGDMERRAPNAIAGAINETLAEAKTDISRGVREVLALSKKSTDSRIRLVKATFQKLNGFVSLSYEKRPGLMAFGAKGHRAGEKLGRKQPGVTYKLAVQGGRKRIREAFIAVRRGQSHENVFVRKMAGGKRVPRKPLVRLMGLSPWGSLVYRSGVLDRIFADAQAAFQKNLDQRVSGMLGGFVKERRAA